MTTPAPPDIHQHLPSAWRPALAFLVLAALIAIAGYAAFQENKQAIKRERQFDLAAVADLKVSQITRWLDERRSDGEDAAYSLFLTDQVETWLEQGGPADQKKVDLLARLKSRDRSFDYTAVMVLDAKGRTRLATAGAAPAPYEVAFALQAMAAGKTTLSDIHWHEGSVEMDLAVPLLTRGNGAPRVIGALCLRIDPQRFLFPLVQSWPTPSASAETLLIHRDGDDAVYVNPLRHGDHPPLSLRLPAGTAKLPAAMAARGQEGIVDGTDYRGVPVVAALRKIPGSHWFMVTKIDESEIYAQVNRLLALVSALAAAFIVAGGLIAALWRRSQRSRYLYLQEHYQGEIERRALRQHFDYLAKYANDIFLLTDKTGRVVEVNDRAQAVYGYTRPELQQLHLRDLRPGDEDPAILKKQMEQLGQLGELQFETTHRRKDGTTFPVDVSARLIEVEGVTYMQGVIRDITARRQAEEEIEASRQRLRELTAFLESVREEERTRIAREVHDELGQVLTALKLNIGWFNTKLDEQDHPLAAKAATLGEIADQAIESARAVAAGLRPKMLDELGLTAAIEWQAEEFQKRTGIRCTLACLEEPGLDSGRASAVFRMVQESLTNVARHAMASEVQIALRLRHGVLLLRVQDDGQGFDPREARQKKSFGLLGMAERALMLGGRAKIRSAPGKGTVVAVLIPLTAA